jgi:hypothetical protein
VKVFIWLCAGQAPVSTPVRLKAKRKADPPFDFAQGRLFGDDNKKSKRQWQRQRRSGDWRGLGREADFSTPQHTSCFGRNDGFGMESNDNGVADGRTLVNPTHPHPSQSAAMDGAPERLLSGYNYNCNCNCNYNYNYNCYCYCYCYCIGR